MYRLISLLCIVAWSITSDAAANDGVLTLDEYRKLESEASDQLSILLPAMYQTAVYAQAAIDHPTICFTPVPLSGDRLRAMITAEIAEPDAILGRAYAGDDPLALILVNALRDERVCR